MESKNKCESPMRIAYLGYDILLPCLRALTESGCSVMELFSFPTDNVFEFNRELRRFAWERGVPFAERPIGLEDIHRLKAAGCRAIFCAGYIYRVPVDHSLPIVNVHPSLLPVGRGAWPMPVTILRGLSESGVTLHKMEEGFDTGDILLQQAFPVEPEDNLETVTAKVQTAAAGLCRRIAADFDRIWENARAQGAGEYWRCPRKSDYTITAETSPRDTERILRAFFGFDCYLKTEEAEYRIVRGVFRPERRTAPFGTVEKLPDGRRRYTVSGGVIETPAEGERVSDEA